MKKFKKLLYIKYVVRSEKELENAFLEIFQLGWENPEEKKIYIEIEMPNFDELRPKVARKYLFYKKHPISGEYPWEFQREIYSFDDFASTILEKLRADGGHKEMVYWIKVPEPYIRWIRPYGKEVDKLFMKGYWETELELKKVWNKDALKGYLREYFVSQ